jgi:hypothetical protein
MGLVEKVLAQLAPVAYGSIFMFACWCLFPIALYIFPRIKSRSNAALLHLALGLGLGFTLFGLETFLLLVAILIGYFVLPISPTVASIAAWSMTFIANAAFVFRSGGWAMDISGNVMCLMQKIIATSFNLDDFRRQREENHLKRWDDVALATRPPLLEWFAYCLTPYGSFSNPFLEFKLFSFVLDCGNRPPVSERERSLAFSQFRWSFMHAAVQLWAWKRVCEDVYDADLYVHSSLLSRLVLMMAFTHVQTGRYFSPWYCVEACFYIFGLMNNDIVPPDECFNLAWSYALSAPNVQEYLRRWNHTTHLFWKNYCYTRMRARGWSRVVSDACTKFASAAWHGFRATFYWMLPEIIFIVNIDRMLTTAFPLEASRPFWKRALYSIWTLLVISHIACTFYYPSTATYFRVRNSFYWVPEIVTVAAFVVCQCCRSDKRKKE